MIISKLITKLRNIFGLDVLTNRIFHKNVWALQYKIRALQKDLSLFFLIN